MGNFYPEGKLINSQLNTEYLASLDGLKKALDENKTLEANVFLCDNTHNLKLDIPNVNAYILHDDVAIGIEQGKVREIAIISKVGLPVCFKVVKIDESEKIPTVYLSRKLAQIECVDQYINNLQPGDVITAKITHIEGFGAFVDLGCGIISFIGIENISVSRINHPSDRFERGQEIFCIVSDKNGDKISLSHKELLGTWQENADLIEIDTTMTGVVRSIESYGIFVELFPNLSGLAEIKDDIQVSDAVSVHIKSINPQKMKIKLNIIRKVPKMRKKDFTYFIKEGRVKSFKYSPKDCKIRNIYRDFY
ncbi:MAG: S1 RNA-binding domain-containing protein [Clostridia bacterium]